MRMPSRDPRIDAYIARQADFARPILDYVREAVHEACPGVEETMKWSAPSFLHGGAILCGMAAFKQHASFGYWKHALVVGDDQPRNGMGSYGKLTSVADLPPKTQLLAHIRKAMQLNEAGVASPAASRPKKAKPPVTMPEDLSAALRGNAKARATFDAFPPGQQREYVEWITDARRDETRQKRLLQAIEWLAEGKRRNWKYERC
jgi:uncharacterized protein YdeI (YjbR/CyaY-like superfamily)